MSAWNEFAAAWWQWLAPAAWHATWLGLAAAALERAFARRLAPAYRAALWWLFFACLAAPRIPSPLAVGARELVELDSLEPARSLDATPMLAALWLAGALVCIARLVLGERRGARSLATRSRPAPAALVRELARLRGARCAPRTDSGGATRAASRGAAPRLRLARELASPVLHGLLRPTIYLPERLRHAPREREHALRHELAHVARRDPLRALAVECLCALFWFHPLAWFGARRLALARELACDARVAAELGEHADLYRATLARAALRRVEARALGALGFLGGARIVERLRALERTPRLTRHQHAAFASALFAVGCVTLLPTVDDAQLAQRAFARDVLAAQAAGTRTSCFTLHAAALALRDELPSPSPVPHVRSE
ncbi:MAG: M56 family metallopeptidase [Planctomycetes bacterium]|nr:M56 family metallopeptidase [Planctomycetota bacterium]